MNKPDIDDMRNAVERMHNCKATYAEEIAVIEKDGDKTVWDNIVYIFDLVGHSKATQCYAWASPIEGLTRYTYYTVLRIPPIDSPEQAIRASIAQKSRTDTTK
jgi:hypothetical protein